MNKHKLDLFLLIIAAGFLINGLLIQQGTLSYPIPLHSISHDIGTIDASNSENNLRINLILKSYSFSANNPIEVEATIESQNTDESTMYLYFPQSVGLPLKKTGFAQVLDGAKLTAINSTDDQYYKGETKMKYPHEGCYPILASSKEITQIEQSALDPEFPCKLISISSLEATNSMYANRTIIGLTYVILALSLLGVRPILHSFLNDFDENKT